MVWSASNGFWDGDEKPRRLSGDVIRVFVDDVMVGETTPMRTPMGVVEVADASHHDLIRGNRCMRPDDMVTHIARNWSTAIRHIVDTDQGLMDAGHETYVCVECWGKRCRRTMP